jgi:hypothetical protein
VHSDVEPRMRGRSRASEAFEAAERFTCWSTPQPPPMILLFRRHECCGEELTNSSSALQQIEHRSDGFVERDGTLSWN